MHTQIKNLEAVKTKISEVLNKNQFKKYNPQIVAISKTFSETDIIPLAQHGHVHFGENKVQEAEKKWRDIKLKFNHVKLHMVGQLQTNKVKKAVELFDFIHSLDSIKLADKICHFENIINKKTKLFIQVNLGNENQKAGVPPKELDNFYEYCATKLSLNIIGLMCLPPYDENSNKYFETLKKLSDKLSLNELSMGMSNDYLNAINYKATYLRIGTSIFGTRQN